MKVPETSASIAPRSSLGGGKSRIALVLSRKSSSRAAGAGQPAAGRRLATSPTLAKARRTRENPCMSEPRMYCHHLDPQSQCVTAAENSKPTNAAWPAHGLKSGWCPHEFIVE